jgi:hypothetical protein
MENKVLLILTDDDNGRAEESAFNYAKSTSKTLVVLQILTSNLYHYGHHDVIATRPSKRQFLLYIRDEVLRRARAKAATLMDRAQGQGIGLEILSVESEDPSSAAVKEARKGYEVIFVSDKKRPLFPLFEKTLAQHLQKKTTNKIIRC